MNKTHITNIKISNLYDRLNYDIPFPSNQPVSVLIAPNGAGKTTILNLLYYIFGCGRFEDIFNVPFDSIRISLSNGKTVVFSRLNKSGDTSSAPIYTHRRGQGYLLDRAPSLTISETDEYATCTSYDRFEFTCGRNFSRIDFMLAIYQGKKLMGEPVVYSEMDKKCYELYGKQDEREGFSAESEEEYERLHNASVSASFFDIWIEQDEYLRKYDCNIDIVYINTKRTLQESMKSVPLEKRVGDIRSAIEDQIKRTSSIYFQSITSLHSSLISSYLQNTINTNCSYDEFRKKWDDYQDMLVRLQKFDMVPEEELISINEDTYNAKKEFLNIYLQTFSETLGDMMDLYTRLNLLKEIIDSRNQYTGNVLTYDQNVGMFFTTCKNTYIPVEELSSGELHDLIMFYNLIFNDDTLLLIDEPEISEHISWQKSFLNKLIEICAVNNNQAIVTTHSPYITKGHNDLILKANITKT